MSFYAKFSAEEIATALDPKARRRNTANPPWWDLRCPGHDDKSPSFSLTVAENGLVSAVCRSASACQPSKLYEILEARGLIESWETRKARFVSERSNGCEFPDDLDEIEQPVEPAQQPPTTKDGLPPGIGKRRQLGDDWGSHGGHWLYRKADGREHGYMVRYDMDGGGKQFLYYFKLDKGVWKKGLNGAERVPYNLHLCGQWAASEPLLVVEGEKCADAIVARGGRAVTWMGGANSAGVCKWDYLAGRTVVLWPDNDDVGRNAMLTVRRRLVELGCSVQMIDVGQVPELAEEGADAVDYFAAGKSLDDVWGLPIGESDGPKEAEPEEDEGPQPLAEYDYTDLGNAKRMAEVLDGNVRFVEEWGWMTYKQDLWRPESMSRSVMSRADDLIDRIKAEGFEYQDPEKAKKRVKWSLDSQSGGHLDQMVKLLKSRPAVWGQSEDFDLDDDLLCVKNGYVSLKTGELFPHERGRMMTRQCNASYVPGIQSKRYLDFLFEIFGGDEELVQYVLSIIGYSMTGYVSEEVFFILYGVGKNGKSKLIEALSYVMGGYARTASSDLLIGKKQRGGIPNDIARLKNIRMVVTNESGKGEELDEARVKEMTGGDTMTARFLQKEFFDFSPKFKIWLRTNHLPEISGGDEGIWRRVLTIPFNVEIPEEKRDKQILQKLKEDADAILTLGVQYAVQWHNAGFPVARAVTAEVDRYRQQMDHFASWYSECCYVNRENQEMSESGAKLWDSYHHWCHANDVGGKKLRKHLFWHELTVRKFPKQKGRESNKYLGIMLREKEQKRINIAEEQKRHPGMAIYQDHDIPEKVDF